MKNTMKLVVRLALVAALSAGVLGCNSVLDDGDGPNVVLTVEQMTIPVVTAAVNQATLQCVFTVSDATATLKNQPKSAVAGESPFNDVVMESVTVSYAWDDPALVTAPRTFPLGGTVPAGGTGTVMFPPIASGDLTPAFEGHTAGLTMVFTGRMVDGTPITANGGGSLTVNFCQ